MAREIGLRKQPVQPPAATPAPPPIPPPAASPPLSPRQPPPRRELPPGVRGRLPFQPGQLLAGTPAGLVPVAPPEGRAAEAAAAAAAVDEEAAAAAEKLARSDLKPKLAKPVDINTLPAERQRQVRQTMQDMMRDAPPPAAPTPPTPPAGGKLGLSRGPSTLEALAAAEGDGPEQTAETPAPGPTAPPPGADDEPMAAGEEMTHCPHCLQDLSRQPENEPDEDDKFAYVAAILSGRPFLKDYQLLGGQLRVVFRSLTIGQSELVFAQLAVDRAKGRVATVEDAVRYMTAYRLLLSMHTVVAAAEPTYVAQEVDDYLAAEPRLNADGETPLPHILETIEGSEMLSGEGLWRILAQTWQKFVATTSVLERRAADPNFWTATAS